MPVGGIPVVYRLGGLMTKEELCAKISRENLLMRQDVEEIVTYFTEEIAAAMTRGERVTIRGFGTFSAIKRKTKKARNIHANEEIIIPEHMAPKFQPCKALKERIEKGA